MTDLPLNPTPRDVAALAWERSGLSGEFEIDRVDVKELMADAVQLDRRQRLARRAAVERNYLYEATMSDYSIVSIDRGKRALELTQSTLLRNGLTLDDVTVWDNGTWRPVIS